MSWQAAAFGVLAVALAAGFAWYERVRPDARIVALVGTLAAFAALGRIAFAAVPNVKPTTDIVLISGYALGGGPGFAVGALAGLTSNFFFGQGPWTPWQMAAWGATGMIGAALAWVVSGHGRRRDIGRWPLALVCCAVGFAFTAVQDFGDWVTYSDHSWAQLIAYVGQGLGFDAVHAAGCLLFALALGPALVHSIARFARRLQVTWLSPDGVAAPLVAGALAIGALGVTGAASTQALAAPSPPAAYLLGAENPDGGFGDAPGQPSAQLYSGWAALGLASAGYDLNRVSRGGAGLIGYIRSGVGSLGDVGSLERTILVVQAAGLRANQFGGHNLIAQLVDQLRGDGSVSDQVNLTAFAILALRSAGVAPGGRTLAWLAGQQAGDGGFGFAGAGSASDVDDTGAVLEALANAGDAAAQTRSRAVAYLRRQQNPDGGLPEQAGGPSNAQSTAWAIQGLDAVGVDPDSLHRASSASPLAWLRSLVAPGGQVRYSEGVEQTPVWVTGESLMALEGKSLPLTARPASAVSRARARARPAGHIGRGAHRPPPQRAGVRAAAAQRTGSALPHQRKRRQAATALSDGSAGSLLATVEVISAVALAPLGMG